MTETLVLTAYGVGWYLYTPGQLETLFPGELAIYREEAQSIVAFGHTEDCWKDTPEEAQAFLNQILSVNSDNNLKTLAPLGADGLFIVEREVFDNFYFKLSRYASSHASTMTKLFS